MMGEKIYPFDDSFSKEQTLLVKVCDTKLISPESVIDEIERKCGIGSVLACVPKFGTCYEIVMGDKKYVGEIAGNYLSIKGKLCSVIELVSNFKIVSIINLSMYVTDEEIIDRFNRIGVEIVSDIKKRKWNSRSKVYDGTRVFKAKLPPTLASIPYSMKFSVNNRETAYYRVIHNNQVKVCSGCLSTEHLYKDCPEFVCYECGKQGHIGKNCPDYKCKNCKLLKSQCDCAKRPRYYGEGFGENPAKRTFGFPRLGESDEKSSDNRHNEGVKNDNSGRSENSEMEEKEISGDNSEPISKLQSSVKDTSHEALEVKVPDHEVTKSDMESNDEDGDAGNVNYDSNIDEDDVENSNDTMDVLTETDEFTPEKQLESAIATTTDISGMQNTEEGLDLTVNKNVSKNAVMLKSNTDNLIFNESVVSAKNDNIISPLEQTCSQEGDESAYGDLDEITMDTCPLTDGSQGGSEGEKSEKFKKNKLLKIKKKERRNKLKIKPNVKAAMLKHQENNKK